MGDTMTEHAVVIAGGGPTGLMLAAELALAGIDVAIVERRATQELVGSRASGLHARTVEVLDHRGIAERFVSQGQKHPAVYFHIPLYIEDFPTRHNYTLGLWQKHFERILGEWVSGLAVTMYRGREVAGFTQHDSGVEVAVSDGTTVRAQYLIGCDGARSTVRRAAGIEFPGWDATTSWLIAEGDMTEEPKWGFHEDARGRHAIGKGEEGIPRFVLVEPQVPADGEPTLQDVREQLIHAYGTDFGFHNPRWISRFTDMTRQAAAYRDRRVLLAGDSAHIHPPMGGQGLNLGVQDAVNLGWKLAQVIKGVSPDTLLDTYHTERHPVGARALRNTMAQAALMRPDDRTRALGEIVAAYLQMDEPRKTQAAEMSGLGIAYEPGGEHPLIGRRMPDLDLVIDNAVVRTFTLMHAARPVFINFAGTISFDITPWQDRVDVVDAAYDGVWEIPVIGAVVAPDAILIRPDGYVAWVGIGDDAGLFDTLCNWFGPPAAQ
jgi:3-(3-hydroxy-phenyl)propionate hydroxylase